MSFAKFALCRFLPGVLLLLCAMQVHAAPKVVVSVLPVHSLVSALMEGIGEPRLLIPGGQSPHASQLKPSQVSELAAADLIVWIGPSLERRVAKIIAQRRGAARIVTLLEHAEITPLPEPQEDDHADDHDHDHWRADPHLWLSFEHAQSIVRIAARELAVLDPPNREAYESNARNLRVRLERLRESLREELRGVVGVPYLVFHDAYRYFEHEFNLHPVGFLTVSAARPPGVKRIRRIKQLIQSQKVRCVFSEPQFQPELVRTLVADTDAASGVLDPLGAGLTPGPDAWFALMRGLADSLVSCLKRI